MYCKRIQNKFAKHVRKSFTPLQTNRKQHQQTAHHKRKEYKTLEQNMWNGTATSLETEHIPSPENKTTKLWRIHQQEHQNKQNCYFSSALLLSLRLLFHTETGFRLGVGEEEKVILHNFSCNSSEKQLFSTTLWMEFVSVWKVEFFVLLASREGRQQHSPTRRKVKIATQC